MRRQINIVFVSITIILLGLMICGCQKTSYLGEETEAEANINTESSSKKEADNKDSKSSKSLDSGKYYVQVTGAVNNPGVFELDDDSRVCHAILAAGGLREDADDSSLNQAEKITDGLKIVVMTKEQQQAMVASMGAADAGKVNINTADEKTLMTLPGVGESKARAIIKYRDTKGRFTSTEDIKNISGIKDGLYNKIADSITV